jgi:hypothetical protein
VLAFVVFAALPMVLRSKGNNVDWCGKAHGVASSLAALAGAARSPRPSQA